MKHIALFDLDNTLIGGDSDYAWCQFLIDRHSSADRESEARDELYRRNEEFMCAHEAGTLDMEKWLRFSLGLMKSQPIKELLKLREEFMSRIVVPMIAPAASALVTAHRSQSHELVLITATNHFVATPIAEHFGIEHLIATQAEECDGFFTGRAVGTWCFREGKVSRLRDWLDKNSLSAEHGLKNSYAYSDSHNDLPLLKAVTQPVAVNPDQNLLAHAREQGWQVMDLRSGSEIKFI